MIANRVEIEVTQADWDHAIAALGTPGSCYTGRCLLATAITRVTGIPCTVGYTSVNFHPPGKPQFDRSCYSMRSAIKRFDMATQFLEKGFDIEFEVVPILGKHTLIHD